MATASEARFAVAVLAIRDATIAPVPLAPWDHLAAIQIAAVELALPVADPVTTARWACLALGALGTLLLWPVLRGFGSSLPASAVAVGALGVALPVLALHSGVTTAAVGGVWLALAAALVVGNRTRAAGVVALVAVATVPLAAAPLLVLAAAVVLAGAAGLPPRLRTPAWVVAVLAAAGVVLAALPGAPLAATTGPDIALGGALVGAAAVVGLGVLAGLADRLLLPVLAAAVPLVVVGLLPGPSRAAAAVLVTPVVAVAVAAVVDQVRARVPRRPLRLVAVVGVVALVAVLAVPLGVVASAPAPVRGSLAAWVTTQTGPGTLVVADPLDRAELQAAGFPVTRLRAPSDPPVAGEVRVVSDRPGGPPVPSCPAGAVLARTPSGSGGAPGVVCGAFTPATVVEGKARARLGAQLVINSALRLDPGAAQLLRDGTVDPRLMLTLAALTSAHRVGVAAFPAVPLDAPGALRRMVVLSAFDGAAPASSPLLRNWLTAQQAPFAPTGITANGTDLVLNYPVPSPTGLLPL